MKNKLILTVSIIVLFLFLFDGCTHDITSDIPWEHIAAVPFSGYICGIEGTSVLLQIPAFGPGHFHTDFSGLINTSLIGKDAVLECHSFKFINTNYDSPCYTSTALFLEVDLGYFGEYVVNTLRINFEDGSTVDIELGNICFFIEEQTIDHPIYMHRSHLTQSELTSIQICYTNSSEYPITIVGIEFPTSDIPTFIPQSFLDWELLIEAESLTIPAGQTRTFTFNLESLEHLTTDKYRHFLALPLLTYSLDGITYKMPAQIQPIAVSPPYTSEDVYSLLNIKE